MIVSKKAYLSDWIVPVCGTPVQNAAIIVDNGIIDSIVEFNQIDCDFEYLPGILLPGFVNAHTHLELSYLNNKIKSTKKGMVEWLDRLNDCFISNAHVDKSSFIKQAMQDLNKYGVVAVGDVSNTGETYDLLSENKFAGIVFKEHYDGLGVDKVSVDVSKSNGYLSIVPSPHSLYATSGKLIDEMVKSNIAEGYPTSIHWLESMNELEFYANHKSGIYSLLNRLWPGIESNFNNLIFPKDFVNNYFNDKLILVHALESDDDMIQEYKKSNVNIVLCPRSNEFISGKHPDFDKFYNSNISFAIGSDSLASVENLDVRRDMAFIRDHSSIHPHELLNSLTINGAKVLNLETKFGSIVPGKLARVVLLDAAYVGADVEQYVVNNIDKLDLKTYYL